MSNQIKGKVSQVFEVISGQGKEKQWFKQSFVIETEDKYPKKVHFTFWGSIGVEQVSQLKIGQQIEIYYEPESREFNGKYYTDLKVWKIVSNQPVSYKTQVKDNINDTNVNQESINNPDDLPF